MWCIPLRHRQSPFQRYSRGCCTHYRGNTVNSKPITALLPWILQPCHALVRTAVEKIHIFIHDFSDESDWWWWWWWWWYGDAADVQTWTSVSVWAWRRVRCLTVSVSTLWAATSVTALTALNTATTATNVSVCTHWNKHWCRLRPSLMGQDRSVTKQSVLVLVLQVLCCVVKHGLVTLVVKMISKDTATFQVLFIVSSLF